MLGSYASILRRRFWLTVLTVAAFVSPIAFLALTTAVGDDFQSTGLIQVRQGTVTEGILGQSRSYEDPERRLATELEILGSRVIAESTAAALADQGFDVDADDVSRSVEVAPRGASSFIEVVGSDPRPGPAQALTAAYIGAYVDYKQQQELGELERLEQELSAQVAALEADLDELEGPDAAGVSSRERTAATSRYTVLTGLLEEVRLRLSVNTSSVEVLAEGSTPERPPATLSPGPAAVLSVLASLLLGYGIAVLLDLVRDPVRTRAEAQALLEAPVLAELEAPPKDAPGHGYGSSARALEAGRLLRLRLRDADGVAATTVLVTAPDGGRIAAQVAGLLASSTAADGEPVHLVGLPEQSAGAANGRHSRTEWPSDQSPFVTQVQLSDWLADRAAATRDNGAAPSALCVVVVHPEMLAAVVGTSPREVVVVVCELERTRARPLRGIAEELRHTVPVRTGLVLLSKRRRRGGNTGALVRLGPGPAETGGAVETERGDDLGTDHNRPSSDLSAGAQVGPRDELDATHNGRQEARTEVLLPTGQAQGLGAALEDVGRWPAENSSVGRQEPTPALQDPTRGPRASTDTDTGRGLAPSSAAQHLPKAEAPGTTPSAPGPAADGAPPGSLADQDGLPASSAALLGWPGAEKGSNA